MRIENLKPSLKTYYRTRMSLIDPLIIVLQLVIAGYNSLCSKYLNFSLNLLETFILFFKQFSILTILLLLGLLTHKLRSFTRKEAPYLIVTSISGIFLNQYLFLKSQQHSDPFYVALWQPLVPVFATGASIVFDFEPATRLKLLGFGLCSMVVISNMIWDAFS